MLTTQSSDHLVFSKRVLFIREHVGMLKLTDTYDIVDSESGQQVAVAKERVHWLIHILRLLVSKMLLPTRVNIYAGADPNQEAMLLFSIKRGIAFFTSRVEVIRADGSLAGWLKSKFFSLGGAFQVFDAMGNEIALVQGDWKGWNFRLLDPQEQEIGTVTKKWAGLGKELFTTADNYVIAYHGDVEPAKAMLLLAAGLSIDIVFKER